MSTIDTTNRGTIFRVPPDAAQLQHDSWWHWYILVGTDAAARQAVLIYGTGSEEEHAAAPPLCLDVQPPPAGPAGTGVTKWTHFTPPAIMRVDPAKLSQCKGTLPSTWAGRVAAKVRDGIGYRTGLGIDQGLAHPAHRGKIARLKDEAKAAFNTRFALVLTPHDYSRARRYQCVVPIYDTRRTAIAPDPRWVQLESAWAPRVTDRRESTGFYAAVDAVVSVWEDRHIDHIFEQSFSRGQIEKVEQGVYDYLVLANGS